MVYKEITLIYIAVCTIYQRLNFVIRSGLEPETVCLEGRCSIQLSYRTKCVCGIPSFASTKLRKKIGICKLIVSPASRFSCLLRGDFFSKMLRMHGRVCRSRESDNGNGLTEEEGQLKSGECRESSGRNGEIPLRRERRARFLSARSGF